MSKSFLVALVVIFGGFAGFELYLNLALRRLPVATFGVCEKPAGEPRARGRTVFYFAAGTPIGRGTQVRP
jgi:hypothetical protein